MITERFAPPTAGCCSICSRELVWRCHDCFGEPSFCTSCCRKTHQQNPFHRVSRSVDGTFIRSSLRFAHVTLNLGHRGSLCPCYAAGIPLPSEDDGGSTTADELPDPQSVDDPFLPMADHQSPNATMDVDFDDDEFDDEQLELESGGLFSRKKRYPKGFDAKGHPYVVVVDITGVHHLATRACICEPSHDLYLQYLQSGLYPISQEQPQTVFTFRVLEDYNITNLESKASAQSYYAKLRRLTDDSFPSLVPDRYRELLRATREWRNLKARQATGFAYRSDEVPKGGLVPFCPTCPQPGVNLPEGWKNDPNQYVSILS